MIKIPVNYTEGILSNKKVVGINLKKEIEKAKNEQSPGKIIEPSKIEETKVKWLKEKLGKKVGDIIKVEEEMAKHLVEKGDVEYVDEPKLNWEQKQAIKLETENKLPELSEFHKEQGRKKQVEKVLDDIKKEDKQKEESEEIEEVEIYKQLQKEYIIKKNKLSNELFMLQIKVVKKLAEKQRDVATELIVEYIEKNYYIYTTKDDIQSEMWIYKEGIYIPNGRSVIREFCRKVLDKSYTNFLGNIVIAKIETDTFITQEEFFNNKYIEEIPVLNGIINVLTKRLNPYNPKKIFFNKLPIIYSPDSLNPNIEQFLKDILDKEEDLIVMYEVIGSGLYKDYFTEKAVMLVGSGRNGKSKLLELIKRLVGVENCCCVPIRSMKEDNSSLCELHSRLFNLAGDLSGGDLKDTGVFKQTVGRDTLQTHRKYLRDLIFVNYAKHIFACNELPRVFDTTDGFWDKWILLNFPHKFVTQKEYNKLSEEDKKFHKIKDPDIINKISTTEELSGLFNKAIEGLHRLLKQKNYSQSKGTKEIKDFWIRNSDSFTAFCIDNILQDNQSYITKKELRNKFNIYCKKFNLKGAGDKSIKATLEDRYGVIDERKMIDGGQKFVWEGIKFKWKL